METRVNSNLPIIETWCLQGTQGTQGTQETEETEEELITCDICGKEIMESEAEHFNGEEICSECLDNYFICEHCKKTTAINDLYYSPNGNVYCYDCFYDNCCVCEYCGDTLWNDDSYWYAGSLYCESCFYQLREEARIAEYAPEFPKIYTDLYRQREEARFSSILEQDFDIYKQHWRNVFLPTVAEFYTLQLFKEINRRPDGLNMFDMAEKDIFTGEYKINIGSALYALENMSNVDKLHGSPYWNGFISKNDKREAEIVHELEQFFVSYIFMTCIGEARHVAKCSDCEYAPEWLPVNTSNQHAERNDVWFYGYWLLNEIKQNPNSYNLLNMSKDIYRVFTENKWHSSYGGEKWANIIGHLVRYLKGEINKTVFVDQSISLVHNGSLFVDKIGVRVSYLKTLLDLKFEAETIDMPRVIAYIETKHIKHRYNSAFEFAWNMLYCA